MPTYEYECKACGHTFELRQSMSAKPITECPKCKKNSVKRLIGAGAGVIFKGSGFYQTDYKHKGTTCATSSCPAGDSSEKKSDSPAPPCPAADSCPCAKKD
ncbi:MAG: zinc ribbon domain-containing protein [Candidatus Sumerlaeia bacterium]